MTKKHLSQELRIFASVDLIGSTKMKGCHSADPRDYSSGRPHWHKLIEVFYRDFVKCLEFSCNEYRKVCHFELVKSIGDELIFSSIVNGREHAYKLTKAFQHALRKFNNENKNLCVKGALWIAGFPINNAKIIIEDGKIDYIGPSIDTGFRIAKFASKLKLVLAVDLVLLLCHHRASHEIPIFFDGYVSLKGVLNETEYPIFWTKGEQQIEDPPELQLAIAQCKESDVFNYCKRFIANHTKVSWLIEPYFHKGREYTDMPELHDKIYKQWASADDINVGASKTVIPGNQGTTLVVP